MSACWPGTKCESNRPAFRILEFQDLLDVLWPQYGQIVVNGCVWAVCGVLYLRIDRSGRPALIACLIIATAGEIFLSLVWGLYEYRLHNIPLFVPPGHVLLF